MLMADFEPGILFLLLWGLISWLSRKKKKKINTDLGEVKTKPKEDLFARLQKLQEHLSQEVDIFTSAPPPSDSEENYFTDDDYEKIEIPIAEIEDVDDIHKDKEYGVETAIKVPPIVHDNWLKQNLSQKSNLRKLMVLKEVLGEPRSLNSYTGDYFQS